MSVQRVYVSLATLLALQGERLPDWMRRVAYLLVDSRCNASCTYCWLPRGVAKLARVPWHPVKLGTLLSKVHIFERVCIQTVIKPGIADRVVELVEMLKRYGASRVSVAIGSASPALLKRLHEAGVDVIGVGLDAASERIARLTRRPYSLAQYMRTIRDAVKIYGESRVYAHVIVGLGESAKTLVHLLDKLYAMGARAALFAYTPLDGKGKPPRLCYYRGAQVYKQLLEEGLDPLDYIEPGEGQYWILKRVPELGIVRRAVKTSGCPPCNRPFYTESPRGPLYNIPWEPSVAEARQALHELLECGA